MANFRLADTMDTAKPLLQPVRIPRQIIVYHQMRSLQVDTLAGGIRCNQHTNTYILLEKLLGLAPFVTEHPTMNRDDSFLVAKQRADFVCQIIQRIFVLSKYDELLTLPIAAEHLFIILKEPGQLLPLPINAADTNLIRHLFQTLQCFDFRFQLSNRCCGRSMVNDLFLQRLLLVGRQVIIVKVVEVFSNVRASFAKTFFRKPVFQTFPPSAERLINRLRRRRKTALQNGQCKANRRSSIIVQIVGPVKFLLHIIGHSSVELCLHVREVIIYGVGNPLREQRSTIEFQKFFLDQTAHHIRDIDGLLGLPVDPLKTVWVNQREEQVKIFLFAIVRGCRQQQEILCDIG